MIRRTAMLLSLMSLIATQQSLVLPTGVEAARPLGVAHATHLRNIPDLVSPGVYIGIWQPGMPQNMAALQGAEHQARKHMAIVMLWRSWGGYARKLNLSWLQAIASHGSLPLITWSPANWDPGTDQSPYTLDKIIAGVHDSYLRKWALQLKTYGRPVLLRWAHEMNGYWYPWSGHPDQYIAAYRHIHDVFTAMGATNVQWVWCPNIQWNQQSQFAPYYPGDSYVDWLALDGYNQVRFGWQSFGQIFRPSYDRITQISAKPLMIAETSSAEATPSQAAAGDLKANWIIDAFRTAIPSMPRIRAVLWFNEDKTTVESSGYDWRITTSLSAQSAFAQAVKSRFYRSYVHANSRHTISHMRWRS
ncbi:MAG: hypothetical protein NVSMB52_18050 [Chloroflexota bacterium]